jgi:hypothetical protein
MAIFADAEVKEAGGSYTEATVQLGTWAAAGLEKTARLANAARAVARPAVTENEDYSDVNPNPAEYDVTRMMPLVGWTVVGHVWSLHISYKERDGSVVSFRIYEIVPYSRDLTDPGPHRDLDGFGSLS